MEEDEKNNKTISVQEELHSRLKIYCVIYKINTFSEAIDKLVPSKTELLELLKNKEE